MAYRVPFGVLTIDEPSRRRLEAITWSAWLSEGRYVAEFEGQFAAKFGWKHCIATSSGTDAGIVVWAAIRELDGRFEHYVRKANDIVCDAGYVITPACAFVATANCVIAAGLEPCFLDVALDTLNLNSQLITNWVNEKKDLEELIGIQFVATMGKPSPVGEVAAMASAADLWLVGDFCEAHGATLLGGRQYADRYCDAAIYSFYAAHLIVGGEGGCIVTNDDELAALCRSIKSHGRPANGYFSFDRIGFNSKWNEPCAAVALGSLARFDTTFERRREVREKLLRALAPFEDKLILYRDGPGEVIAPHGFPLVLRDPTGVDGGFRPLYYVLEQAGVQCKTLFGSLPTQHKAFEFLDYRVGDFPVAERVGQTGLHFGCHELISDEDIALIAKVIDDFFSGKALSVK